MPRSDAKTLSGIFVSYHRDDASGHAGRLFDKLSDHFGETQIFMDVETMQAGEDFVKGIVDAIGSCEILIAIIGRRWLLNPEDSSRRLDNPNDFVRLEIATAFNRDLHVVPVLVDGAVMPRAHDLPNDLAKLPRLNAIEIGLRFHRDVDQVISALERILLQREEARCEAETLRVEQSLAAQELHSQGKNDELTRTNGLTLPDSPHQRVPKLVRNFLILFGVVIYHLSLRAAIEPYFSVQSLGDLLTSDLRGFLPSGAWLIVAIAFGGAAFGVHRNYLQRKLVAQTLVHLFYFISALILLAGLFFTLAAATMDFSELRLEGVTNQRMALMVAGPFLIISLMILLLGRLVQRLFGQERRKDRLAAKSAVGCLRIGSLGCALWAALSAASILITGKMMATGEPAGLRELFIGGSGFILTIFLMLAVAWFISANIPGADLNRANLQAADVREPDLTGAVLEGTNLTHAKLTRANFSAEQTSSGPPERNDLR